MHKCESGPLCAKKHCPYYHKEEEMRRPPNDLRLYPRNRGTSAGQCQLYQDRFLTTMFKQVMRVNKFMPYRKNNPGPVQRLYP